MPFSPMMQLLSRTTLPQDQDLTLIVRSSVLQHISLLTYMYPQPTPAYAIPF